MFRFSIKRIQFKSVSILLFFVQIFCSYNAIAQSSSNAIIPITGDWEDGGNIYEDPNVSVQIEFKLSLSGCDSNGFIASNNFYRFKIKAKKKIESIDKYLSFKIIYEDCYDNAICKTVNLNIGVPQRGDKWDGFQPLLDDNLDNTFRGKKVLVPFSDVNIRWQKDNTKDSECFKIVKIPVQKEIELQKNIPEKKENSILPSLIKDIQSKENCPGSKLVLYPVGGKLLNGDTYEWTKDSCDGEVLSNNDTLVVSPLINTKYYLKIKNSIFKSECLVFSHEVKRNTFPKLEIENILINENNQVVAQLKNLNLKNSEYYAWYKNSINPYNKLPNKSRTLTVDYEKNTFYLARIENQCGVGDSLLIQIPKPIKSNDENSILLNIGANLNGNQNILPFNIMLGYAFLYFKYKNNSTGNIGNISNTLTSNNSKILNYPPNTNTFYQISDKVGSNRSSFTIGYMYPKGKRRLYIGLGYGNQQTYWNAKTYNYSSPSFEFNSQWVKNIDQSYSGIEIEAGILLKMYNKINVSIGTNLINSGINGNYISMDFGLGIFL